MLVVKSHSQFAVATFQRVSIGLFSSNRPASLSVAPQAVHILDDIVTTAVWFEEKRYRREKSRRNGAGASMAGGGGGGGGGGC